MNSESSKTRRRSLLVSLGALLALSGCTQMSVISGTGGYDSASSLGAVHACKGGNCCYEQEGRNHCEWPISLHSLPEFDIQYALKQDAAKRYNVDPANVALDVVQMKTLSEGDGTIRGWDATSNASLVTPNK